MLFLWGVVTNFGSTTPRLNPWNEPLFHYPIFFQFLAQCIAGNAKPSCAFAFVAPCGLHSVQNDLFFRFRKGAPRFKIVINDEGRFIVGERFGIVLRKRKITCILILGPCQNNAPFNNIDQFPHISRPFVSNQPVHGFGCKPLDIFLILFFEF